MSRCAHEQGGVKVRKLPKCSRCKQEFMLVTVQYETKQGKKYTVEEWECQKCNKSVPKEYLKEEEPSDFEKFLRKKSKELNDERRRQKEQDRRESAKRTFRKQSK